MGLENLKTAFSNISQNVQETKDKTTFDGDYRRFLPMGQVFDSFRETDKFNFSFGSFLPMSDMFGRILPIRPIGENKEKPTKSGIDLTQRYNKPTKGGIDLTIKFEKPTKSGIDLTTKLEKTTKDHGVVDYIANQKAPGFSIKQSNQSSTTLFTGISRGNTWINDINLGGSIYGIEAEPQKVGNFATKQEHKSPTKLETTSLFNELGETDFINNTNSYYNPIMPKILGFSSNFNKGGYTFGIDQKGNSKFLIFNNKEYSGMVSTATHTDYHIEGSIFDNTIQLTSISPSKWDSDSLKTTYYDSIHTQNSITDKFGGPVNFIDMENKYTTGFTISGLGNLLTTQFVGVDNKGATWDPTTSYYDKYAINIPNFSKTFGDEAEGFSMETSDGQTVKFTTNVDVINTIGKPGNSEFLQTKNIIHPYNKTLPSNDPSGTSLLDVWSRAADIGSDKDGNILKRDNANIKLEGSGKYSFPGFHMKWVEDGENTKRGGIIFHGKTEPDSAGSGDVRLNDVSYLGYGDLVLSKTWAGTDISPKSSTVFSRLGQDTVRIGKFLKSSKGLNFIANQNILGIFQQYKPLYDPASTLASAILPAEGISIGGIVIPAPFIPIKKDFGPLVGLAELVPSVKTANMEYSEWLDERLKDAGEDDTFAKIEIERRPIGVGDDKKPSFKGGIGKESEINSKKNMQNSMAASTTPLGGLGKGDPMTLMEIKDYTDSGQNPNLELPIEGMPFYFVDLRDNKKLHFRAYLDGLSETISPTWNSEIYIGRSEPVHRYASCERELSLSLKVVAQTRDEFDMIQQKMNRLTSMCYPEYMRDAQMENKIRMKPPLLKMRIGEYIGNVSNDGVTGFFSSLSISVPDDATWEIKEGLRIPKSFDITIMFKVIHGEVPALVKQSHMGIDPAERDIQKGHYQDFYGYTGIKGN